MNILSSLHQDQRRNLHSHNICIERKACVLSFDMKNVDPVGDKALDESADEEKNELLESKFAVTEALEAGDVV